MTENTKDVHHTVETDCHMVMIFQECQIFFEANAITELQPCQEVTL
jgi:hypothetical protein